MARENSFSDSDGRSLTPDLEEDLHRENLAAAAAAAGGGGRDNISPIVLQSPFETRKPIEVFTRVTPRSNTHNGQDGRPSFSRPPMSPFSQNTHMRAMVTVTPIERFRRAVRKIIALRRGTTFLENGGQIGAEPGVDPRRATADALYGHIAQDCVIEVIDYSAVRSSFGRMTNREFVDLMGDANASEREPWVKVRWINIAGLSWDVVKAVSLRYNLHPLALEDIFHTRSQNRSKADYFSRHLFLRVLCHELVNEEVNDFSSFASGSTLTDMPRSTSPEPIKEDEKLNAYDGVHPVDEDTVYGTLPPSRPWKRRPLLPHHRRDLTSTTNPVHSRLGSLLGANNNALAAQEKRNEAEVSLEALKQGERVNVNVSPMFIFLFRDGTVISIHPTPTPEFTAPIARRLRQRDTGLRTSADASLLVHALLDIIVDRALEVIDEYHTKINKFEKDILLKPQMKTVRYLHILSGDLILHKRTLEPIKTLVYGLRRYDVDRCAALVDTSNPANAGIQVTGFMSHKSKIYLADVFDHMEYILTSLEMFAGVAENLINYTFNIASYEMNEVMRRLTLATIIFLPLTLLTGYFGMNFEFMWSIQGHSDAIFWYIAAPVMCIVLPMFITPDLKRMFHYIQKRIATKKAVKVYKRS